MTEYRILVTGSRDWQDSQRLYRILGEYVRGAESVGLQPIIVHGGARGADAIADLYGLDYSVIRKVFHADWKNKGRAAGPLRNQQMVDYGVDICLAFMNEGSKGTADCVRRAKSAGVPTVVFKA